MRIDNQFIPTDRKKVAFAPVIDPLIGMKYHLSWAYSGAVFVLKRIDADGTCYLDNPRHKRKELLRAKVSDLRHLRTK